MIEQPDNTQDRPELPTQRLPGYELLERIGSGGYGEVWSASAPGGLKKAIKFVFGGQLDKRAANELHALEKIKTVRHPFLLSLERIEVVEGRLLVVSELADGSLRDRFCECIEEGLPGVPRAELLGYMRDAADALDYLSREHDLAHLDIKPENLLLVAGHVKVADFGLVKSLSNTAQASLVGGMTPTYSAPEVFRGSPTRHSDQYSLAILFQELLTGSVPFPGVSAAELTLQHMDQEPDLSRLGESDRFALSRALAKDPAHRYETASEFVAALPLDAETPAGFSDAVAPKPTAPRPTNVAPETALNRHSATAVFSDAGAQVVSSDAESSHLRLPVLEESEPITAPTPEPHAGPFRPGPAVFIGVGGTGGRVLRALRRIARERLGEESEGASPALPMLLLDTNQQSLSSATRGAGDAGEGLNASETVSLPLRRPQAYRDKADLLLRWLGRRWLYNIPRSLQTEGIRPLGRLALIDHARQTFQRVRGVLNEAVSGADGQAPSEGEGPAPLRVYLVGSVSGGTGSGMVTDVAYAVRSILARLGVERSTLIGLMTHSSYREPNRSELSRVNAYAWLSECEHFRSCASGYPGDEGVGIPPVGPGVAPFDHTYFLPLGDPLETPAFEEATEGLAEYLYADALTDAQQTLDACRQAAPCEGPRLRSMAVRRNGAGAEPELTGDQVATVRRALASWIGSNAPSPTGGEPCRQTDQVVHGAVAFAGKAQLDPPSLASNCRAVIEASLGGDAGAYAEALAEGCRRAPAAEQLAAIDAPFHPGDGNDRPTSIEDRPFAELVAPVARRLTAEVIAWVMGKVDDPHERVSGAEAARGWLSDRLTAIEADLHRLAASVDTELTRHDQQGGTRSRDQATLIKRFTLRLDQAALVAAEHLVATLQAELCKLTDELKVVKNLIEAVSASFSPGADAPATGLEPAEIDRRAVLLQERIQADYLGQQGGLLRSLATEESAGELCRTIAHVAKSSVRGPEDPSPVGGQAGAEFPPVRITGCGGVRHHVAVTLSEESEVPDLLVTEQAEVSLPHVAAGLVGGRRDYAAFAERVRTRRDIPWVDPVVATERQDAAGAAPGFAESLTPGFDQPMQTAVLP